MFLYYSDDNIIHSYRENFFLLIIVLSIAIKLCSTFHALLLIKYIQISRLLMLAESYFELTFSSLLLNQLYVDRRSHSDVE